MKTTSSQIVADFLQEFMTGDVEKALMMVREDFSFRAPLFDGAGNKAAYFAGAENKARYIEDFRILRQWADGDEVSTIYELDIRTPEGNTATWSLSSGRRATPRLILVRYQYPGELR